MHTREQLEAMISTLQENVELAKKLIEKNPGDESAKLILESQRKSLHDYQERLDNMRVGRPVIGVTKKVSLTLSEDDWKSFDEKAEGNRSQFLRETITDYLEADKVTETKGEYMVNGKDQVLLNDLKEQAIKLKNKISNNSRKIDNPALVTSTLSSLGFFIDNLMDNDDEADY